MCEEERDLGWMTVLLQRKRARGAVKDKTTSLFFVVRISDVSMLPSLSLDFLTLSSEIRTCPARKMHFTVFTEMPSTKKHALNCICDM